MEFREGKYLLKLAETPAEKDQIYLLRYLSIVRSSIFQEKNMNMQIPTANTIILINYAII